MPHQPKAGFTLIELSVVLVIIGLVIGSIVVGKDMIHSGQVLNQIKQFNQYELAYNQFKTKYGCIPGDCAYASKFWSGAVNGNGNSRINNGANNSYDGNGTTQGTANEGNYAYWSLSPEYKNFFIHLELAGLIPGHFDGTNVIGKGMPVLVLNNRGTFLGGDSDNFWGNRNLFSNCQNNSNGDMWNCLMPYAAGNNGIWMIACNLPLTDRMDWWDDNCGIFTPSDMQAMDIKMDDGLPLSGNFYGFGGYSYANPATNQCLSTPTTYNISNTGNECEGVFIFD